ncbi:VCBS repeat-containing protein [Hathewaya histolytica]|uniref:VCBS repeat-containing protein n=1 Tax=Hathewaya histolytica TaxID=1498 RepID=UPI003B67CBEF
MYINIPPNVNIAESDKGLDEINVKSNNVYYEDEYIRSEKDSKFKPPKTIDGYEVLDFKKSDVTGDGFPEYIYLLGKSRKDSPNFKEDIHLFIQDGRTKRVYYITMKDNAGYEPELFLGDLTGDGINDIFVSTGSGGSGGFYYYYIFSYKNGDFVKIFDHEDFSNSQKYNVNFRDYYRVEIVSADGKEKFIIDISHRSREYLDQYYDKLGKLKKPVSGDVTGLNVLFPIYSTFGVKNKFDLFAIQRIIGTYSADGLGYLQTYLSFEDGIFKKVWSQVAINQVGK